VLLLLVDDLKPALGCYGADWARTPHMDRLARRGMRFDRAYCNQALCAPSRNSLLVGARPTSLGIYSLELNFRRRFPDAVTLPQYFRRHGYRAEGVGKVFHIGHGNAGDPESWSVPFQAERAVGYAIPGNSRGGLTREEAYFSNQALDRVASLPRGPAWERADVADEAYADGRIAAEGIRRLRAARERQEPFFLALGFVKPHLPFCAPARYWDLYDPAELPQPAWEQPPVDAPAYAGKTLGELSQYEPAPLEPPLDASLKRTLIHGYFASVSYVDAQIGKVLDELARLELEATTIVVLWGDHGFHLGDHGAWTKHTNYDEANRIPLAIVAPGTTTRGSSTLALVESVDLYPTLAELAGLPAPDGPQPRDGKSLVSLLKDPAAVVRDHAFHCYPRGKRLGRAIRTDRYRLVEWRSTVDAEEPAEYELYDYEVDPLETRNLARALPEVRDRLAAVLAGHPPPR
jgi:iduronate 2-sulfatase